MRSNIEKKFASMNKIDFAVQIINENNELKKEIKILSNERKIHHKNW